MKKSVVKKAQEQNNTAVSKNVTNKKPDSKGDYQPNFLNCSQASMFNDFAFSPNNFMFLQHAIGNRAVGQVIQAKLELGKFNDIYEQEADQVAERIMMMSASSVYGLSTAVNSENVIQRDFLPEEGQIQSKEVSNQMLGLSAKDNANSLESSNSGQPLPDSLREFFEPRFGMDFSQVRIHTDSESVQMNKELGAKAFTFGTDIYFNEEQYNSGYSGKKLLAHELTHVIQQRAKSSLKNILQRKEAESKVTKKVILIGSPSPAEIQANHPYQFVHAARCVGVDENTV